MSKNEKPTVCVIGGGAAGFFAAITCAENHPDVQVVIIEQNQTVLNKVKISGGGRCNVTHACFEPKELVTYYPRGQKELLGPFHKFQPGDTFDWFERRGVELKIEKDNRVFPITDQSSTIIDCLIESANSANVKIWNSTKIVNFTQNNSGKWTLKTSSGQNIFADILILASGSSPAAWEMLSGYHGIIDAVPSLFTFNIQHFLFEELQGVSLPNVEIQVEGHKLSTNGPFLVTHWGISGPAVLKMSAWGARLFHAMQYRFGISINFTRLSEREVETILKSQVFNHPKKQIINSNLFDIPTRFWKRLMEYIKLEDAQNWSDMDDVLLQKIVKVLCKCNLKVNGKSTFKEEFVTAGGIALEEVDFRTMASKKMKNLYFAGEVLDIDALTGGFNFQAAWTTGYLAGIAVARLLEESN
ncbi:MAG TPA: NAD(P)/FAD-dependent oxidoreductase [Chitinophagales bacterium]|nr:NAD(P)/FAD-dependent oxidoreductase [Chitinophagales bacterium]